MDTHATCFLISATARRSSSHGRLSSSGSLAMLAAMRLASSRVSSSAGLININAEVRRAIRAAHSPGRGVGRMVPTEPHDRVVKVSTARPSSEGFPHAAFYVPVPLQQIPCSGVRCRRYLGRRPHLRAGDLSGMSSDTSREPAHRRRLGRKGRRSPSRLLLEIDIGERLPVGVADDEASVDLLDRPGRREVRCSGAFLCLCECIASRSGRAAMASRTH